MQKFENAITQLTGNEWLATIITAAVIIAITAAATHVLSKFLRRVLCYADELPSSSIFVNIGRAAVWIIGGSVLLSTCFGVDVSAAVTALGIGGIAISLGFQDTISNLIGGLAVSLLRVVQPGDNISVGGSTGVVKDVTWRHTTIVNSAGETAVVPNSTINKTSLVHLPPTTKIAIPLVVAGTGEDIDERASKIEAAAAVAVEEVSHVVQPPHLWFDRSIDAGFSGSLIFHIEDGSCATKAKDVALRAVAPFTR